ncbi:hypothetical protein F5J12DRAFT_784132 [Pisolithus orientalis]|uniref:uncharacterized protein n=1 Tax=Pisolithus orientalis TaxID=936130 RepID=UPI0022254711|nr:uncharacterized protein F5J12DRAFT_784132 [Pisolithus orientalis]KAI6001615.1 hypothetical protein F5J12DRAFT_784132 [Pisolithus orientalis]
MPIAATWISLPTFTCTDHNIVTPSDPVHFHSNSSHMDQPTWHSLAQTTALLPPVIQSASMPASQLYLPMLNLQLTQMQFRMLQVVQPSDLLLFNIPPLADVPILHPDGTQTAKSDSWRDIVHHWTEGKPWLDLHILLKDWPYHYYNGKSSHQFNTKYSQQCIIMMEFLNEFQGDEETFLKIYGSAIGQGHMKLLKAILAAHKWYCGAGEHHHCLTSEEVCDNSSSVLQGASKQQ